MTSSQVDGQLQEGYLRFEGTSERVLAVQKVLASKISSLHRHVTQAMATPTSLEEGEETKMAAGGSRLLLRDFETSPLLSLSFHLLSSEDLIAKVEEEVASCRTGLEEAGQEHEEATQQLKALLDEGRGLGLRSKVEEVEGKMAGLAAELQLGAAAIAEEEAGGRVLEEYRSRVERGKEELQRWAWLVGVAAEHRCMVFICTLTSESWAWHCQKQTPGRKPC